MPKQQAIPLKKKIFCRKLKLLLFMAAIPTSHETIYGRTYQMLNAQKIPTNGTGKDCLCKSNDFYVNPSKLLSPPETD